MSGLGFGNENPLAQQQLAWQRQAAAQTAQQRAQWQAQMQTRQAQLAQQHAQQQAQQQQGRLALGDRPNEV